MNDRGSHVRRVVATLHRPYSLRPSDAPPRQQSRTPNPTESNSDGDPQIRSAACARLEAALFLTEEPLPLNRLAEVAGLKDATDARRLLAQLAEHLESADGAFRVEEIAGGYQLFTRPEFAPWLVRLRPETPGVRLTPALWETLTMIAYRQPMTRADLECVRGVDCADALKSLQEKGLVRTAGRQNALGRPQLYGTSKRVLQILGLRSIAELPHAGDRTALV